jgi:HEAT repeat protein
MRALAAFCEVPGGILPALSHGTRTALIEALQDDKEIVRIQAAHAAFLLPQFDAVPILGHMLSDPSWWVRVAAANTLMRWRELGVAALRQAAAQHSDRFARHMAVQVLLDSGEISPRTAEQLRAAG